MKKLTFISSASAIALFVGSANGATTLVDEDWESPAIAFTGDQRVDNAANAGFYPDWSFPSGNTFNIRNGSAGFPSGAGNVLQFEWTGTNATYDTGHNWAATDSFSLDFNASEQSWNSVRDRWIYVEVSETVSGTTLWSQFAELPEYDAGESNFTAGETFSFNFLASGFSGGTEGSAITFEVGQLADAAVLAINDPVTTANDSPIRGLAVDNILLTVEAVPEPSSFALIGLGGLALIMRRRK